MPGVYVARAIAIAVAIALTFPALAQSVTVQADNAWARATPASVKTGVVYMTLTDAGAADKITGISTPVAGIASVHETTNDNGVMRMRAVDGPRLEPGKPVVFKPGGMHIMLEQLKHPLKPGDSFPVTLTFAQSAPLVVTVAVGKPGTAGAPAKTEPGDAMPGMKMNGTNDE